jgi:hypothetical protein
MWEFDLEKPKSHIPIRVSGLLFQRYQARYGTFEISTGISAPSSTPACIRKLKTELRDWIEFFKPLCGSRHPTLVNQGQRHATLAQRLNELGYEPILIPNFDGELMILWKLFQERREPSDKIIYSRERFSIEITKIEIAAAQVSRQAHPSLSETRSSPLRSSQALFRAL